MNNKQYYDPYNMEMELSSLDNINEYKITSPCKTLITFYMDITSSFKDINIWTLRPHKLN